jgi:uncharacterized membrane protein
LTASTADAAAAADEQSSPPLGRMIIAVAALVGLLIALYMLLYKLGAVASLACGSGSCEAVQASPWASFIGLPVPLWGVVGYALIFGLALAGIQPAFADDRRIALGLFLASTFAFAFSMYLSAMEAFVIQAWCRWCIGSAIVASILFLASLAEIPRLRRGAHA